jgi:hypothetical protein
LERVTTGPDGLLVVPDRTPPRCAVLVLAGSSGRVDAARVRLLGRHGAAAMSIRWFGGDGQSPGICEVPLETFGPALDELAGLSDRLAIVGVSKGAEAALLLAGRDPRIQAVAALAPTQVVWANVGPGTDGRAYPWRSSWTVGGAPLPFVPYDDAWEPGDQQPPSYRGLYARSLATLAEAVPRAIIPVETIGGEVLVVAGGDDQVWPSEPAARAIERRRAEHGMATTVVTLAEAGHRTQLPGEPAPASGADMARGGSPEADAALGELAWLALLRLLGLRPDGQ